MNSVVNVTPVVVAKKKSNYSNYARSKAINAGISGYRNFYGHGEMKFYIYPDDNWNTKKWGPKPLLGVVWGDSPFYAEREAYTKQLISVNQTFGVIAVTQQLN